MQQKRLTGTGGIPGELKIINEMVHYHIVYSDRGQTQRLSGACHGFYKCLRGCVFLGARGGGGLPLFPPFTPHLDRKSQYGAPLIEKGFLREWSGHSITER